MGKLCMERVEQDVFFDFVSDYHTVVSAPDDSIMKFTGKHSGDCVGRIVYGEEHKRYYINTTHDEPAIVVSISEDGVVSHGVAKR